MRTTAAEERFRALVESNPTATVVVDEKGHIVLVNRQAELLFGYERRELLGKPVSMLVPLQQQAEHTRQCLEFLAQPREQPMAGGRDLQGVRKNGVVVPVEIGLAPVETEQGRLVVASVLDITERKAAEASILKLNAELERRVHERTAQLQLTVGELRLALAEAERLRQELREQSIRDALTGLFNRRFLEECLDIEVARSSRAGTSLGLLMLDMDKFKHLNDTYGHAAGDAVLRETGRALLESVRAQDVACRYGGDEFVILMPGMSLDDAMMKSAELRERLARLQPQWSGSPLPPVEFSIGVAACPADATTGEQLLAMADAALYRAKHSGGARMIRAAQPGPAAA